MGLVIGIALLIGIFSGFYNAAQKRGLTPWVWGVLSIVSWFGSQFFLGLIWGMLNPRIGLDDAITILLAGLGISIVSLIVLFQILVAQAKNKETAPKHGNDEIMDDTDFDNF
jgi:hypothetical protein